MNSGGGGLLLCGADCGRRRISLFFEMRACGVLLCCIG